MENFAKSEYLKRLEEKCNRLGILFEEIDKRHFFGEFISNIENFQFNHDERSLIYATADKLKGVNVDGSPSKEKAIIE